MKTIVIILIIASFLQTTIIPLDLVLLILICRAYIKSDKNNLYLGFAFGLLVSHLSITGWGLRSLTYLFIIQATHILSKARLAGHPLAIVPLAFVFLSLNQVVNSFIGYQILSWQRLLLEAFLALPIVYLLRLWEERFIVRKEIKLKV